MKRYATIIATGSYLPPIEVSNDDAACPACARA